MSMTRFHAFVAALDHDVGCAELAGELLALVVAAHRNDPLGPHLLGRKHTEKPDRSVAYDDSRKSLNDPPKSGRRAGSRGGADGTSVRLEPTTARRCRSETTRRRIECTTRANAYDIEEKEDHREAAHSKAERLPCDIPKQGEPLPEAEPVKERKPKVERVKFKDHPGLVAAARGLRDR